MAGARARVAWNREHPSRHVTADAAWLRMDRPTNLMIVNSVLWFDEPVDWERCKAVFLDRIVARFDRFRQRAADGLPLAAPHWEDDPGFDPALHFHHVALPAPHDRAALQDFIGDRIATPLDHSRPLWEVYLIDDFGPGCAILVRIHHSIADGIALARVMLTLTDGGEPGPGIADAAAGNGTRLPAWARPAASPAARSSTRASRRCCIPSTRARSPPARRTMPRRSPSCCCRRRSADRDQGRASVAHRVAWSEPVAALAGQARRPCPRRDGQRRARRRGHRRGRPPPPRRGRRASTRCTPSSRSTCARSTGRCRASWATASGSCCSGCRSASTIRTARLAEVKRRMDAIKASHEGAFAYGILGLMGRTPVQVEARLIDFFTAKGSMVLTNVPGPRRPLSLAGTPLARRARVGAVLGQRRDERERVQLRRQGDGRLPHRCRARARPAGARRRVPRGAARARPRRLTEEALKMRAGAGRRQLRLDLDRAAVAFHDVDRRDALEHLEHVAVLGEHAAR